MKKLAIFFTILIGLMILAGCNNSKKNTTNFSDTPTTQTSTTIVETKDITDVVTPPVINDTVDTTKTTDTSVKIDVTTMKDGSLAKTGNEALLLSLIISLGVGTFYIKKRTA